MKNLYIAAVVLLLTITASACTPLQVWEREYLSKKEMSWQPDPLEATLQKHIHFAKEGSSGGGSAAGGGCGCN
jgi:hypothetical protein